MKSINFAVVGLGGIARAHIAALRALPALRHSSVRPVLHTLVTRRPDAVRAEATEMGFAVVTDRLEDALTNPDIHVIDICTPNALHRDAVQAAARAGKAIYCEKPLAGSQADAEAMTDAVARSGVAEQVALNYRYNPAIPRAKRLLELGAIGDIVQFRAAFNHSGYLDPATEKAAWKSQSELAGGGALLDLGVHTLDMVQLLVGPLRLKHAEARTFVRRRAVKAGELDVDVDDWGMLHLDGPNGASGWVETSRIALGATGHRIELFGTNGSMIIDLENSPEPKLTTFGRPSPVSGDHPALQYLPPGPSMGKFMDTHQAALYHFMLRLTGDDPTPGWAPTFADCLAAERLVYEALAATR